MLYLTGQKRGMSKLNLVWPVILTGVHAAVISSPELGYFVYEALHIRETCNLI